MLKKLLLSLCLVITSSCVALQPSQPVPSPSLPRPNLAAMTAPMQPTLDDQRIAAGRHELFAIQRSLQAFNAPLAPQERDAVQNLIDRAKTAISITRTSGSLGHDLSKVIERAELLLNRL